MVTCPGQIQPDSGRSGTRSELLTHAVLASLLGMLSDSATNAAGSLIPVHLLAIVPLLPKRTSVQPRKPSLMLCWKLRDAQVSLMATVDKLSPQCYCYATHYPASCLHDSWECKGTLFSLDYMQYDTGQ